MALRKTQSHTRPQPPKRPQAKVVPVLRQTAKRCLRQEGTNELSAPCGARVSYQKNHRNATVFVKNRPIPMVHPIHRKLFTQFTSESCHTLSATSRRIWSVTGPFFASFSSMALCNSSTVIAS